MSASHTPEPWVVEDHDDCGQAEREVCRIEGVCPAVVVCCTHPDGFHASQSVMRANAERIAACVNACAGIANPAALGDLVKAAEAWPEFSEECQNPGKDLLRRAMLRERAERLNYQALASLRNQQPGEAL